MYAAADQYACSLRHTCLLQVYSPNTDRLSERDVVYGRGTGASTLLLHMTLDPLLFDM
jgi:hypothetical protein